MSSEELLAIFKSTEALLDGHFLLTSGKHSPNYFQCAKVLQYPEHLQRLCGELANFFRDKKVDAVISPALGGVVVGTEVGRQLGVRTLFAERKDGEMTLRRGFEIRPGERFLVVEDVITTGGSIKEVIALLTEAGAEVAGAGSIVDRSNGKAKIADVQFSLLQMEVVMYEPDDCPLCKQGLPLVKPGSRTGTSPKAS
nr:orotate phosphoribosyltransferase [Chloroherpeton thalassium]